MTEVKLYALADKHMTDLYARLGFKRMPVPPEEVRALFVLLGTIAIEAQRDGALEEFARG